MGAPGSKTYPLKASETHITFVISRKKKWRTRCSKIAENGHFRPKNALFCLISWSVGAISGQYFFKSIPTYPWKPFWTNLQHISWFHEKIWKKLLKSENRPKSPPMKPLNTFLEAPLQPSDRNCDTHPPQANSIDTIRCLKNRRCSDVYKIKI